MTRTIRTRTASEFRKVTGLLIAALFTCLLLLCSSPSLQAAELSDERALQPNSHDPAPARLPVSTTFINLPSGFWDKYPNLLLFGGFTTALVVTLLLSIIAKLYQTRRELARSERRYRSIAEASQEGIWLIDNEGITTFANERLGQILGYESREMIGRHLFDFMDEEGRLITERNLARRREGIAETHEFRFIHSSGDPVWTRLATNPVYDEKGHYSGALAMVTDITAERLAHTQLKESEARFRQLTENIREVFWLGSPDWHSILYISPTYEQVWKQPCSTLLHNPKEWMAALLPEDAKMVTDFIQRKIKQPWDELQFPEYRIRWPSGEIRWIEAKAFAIKDENGEVYRVAGVAEDITTRKHTELLLQRRMMWESLLGDISTDFLETEHIHLDRVLDRALASLGLFTNTHRTYLFRLDDQPDFISNTHEWCASGVAAQIHKLQHLSIKDFETLISRLQAGETIFIPSVHSLPDEESRLQANLLDQGIDSLVLAPFSIDGRFEGFIGIDSVEGTMAWNDEDSQMLTTAAEFFAIAIERGEARHRLADARRSMETLLGNLPGMAYQCEIDSNWTMRFISDGVEQVTGYRPEQLIQNTDLSYADIILPEDRDRLAHEVTLAIGDDRHFEFEYRIRRRDGTIRWVWEKGRCISLDSNDHVLEGFMTDITERHLAENSLKQVAIVFDNTAEGILITDGESNIIRVNQAFTRITGYSEEEVLGRNPRLLNSGRQDDVFYNRMWESLHRKNNWEGEIWNRRKNGEIYPEWLSISVVRTDDQITNYVAVFTDISDIKQSQAHIEHLAHHDSLTGLPNRLHFNSRLEHAIERAARTQSRMALLFIDLDGFKKVNDRLGHLSGDDLLRNAATALKRTVRRDDTVARLGGDEFVVIMEGLEETQGAATLAAKLNQILLLPFKIDDQPVSISASIGIALYPDHAKSADKLLQFADDAMYQAKAKGKNRYQFHSAPPGIDPGPDT